MSITWPKLSNIDSRILSGSFNRPNSFSTTQRTCWVRVFSGAVRTLSAGKDKDGTDIYVKSNGLILASSNDFGIFKAAGQSKGSVGSVYGDSQSTGDFGISWDLRVVSSPGQTALRPSPIVTGLEMKEGTDQISRECTLKLRCFTLQQMELMQTYFLEPGYSLCIEFGWNSNSGAAQMVKVSGKTKSILSQLTERNLNYDALYQYRLNSNGDYDTFLGFIVGGNVSSDGDKWNVEVKLRGAPALPTYMQTQNRTLEMTSVASSDSYIETTTFPQYLLEQPTVGTEPDSTSILVARRFRAMFNDLPAMKQTVEIKNFDTTAIKSTDFLNFDALITKKITEFVNPGKGETVLAGDINVEKERLFSKNKYITVDLAVKILNANNSLQAYKMGDKNITVQFDISDSKIGAFPNIFSTKASKLAIPNPSMPDFSIYFLTGDSIKQKANGTLSSGTVDAPPIGNGILVAGTSITFPESTTLTSKDDGFTEDEKYWGYLKNLYINWEVFKEKIQQKNKNIREVFLDMLNEMSSGVNSFWNFQIHEKILKEDDSTRGLKKGDVILSVYDENWIGKKEDTPPHRFYHTGPSSVFLDASLDISVPSEMTNQIISRRLALINNPDEPIVGVGGFFESDTDLFLGNYTDSTGKEHTSKNAQAKADADFEKLAARLKLEESQSSKSKREREVYDARLSEVVYNGDEAGVDSKFDTTGKPLNLRTADAEVEKYKAQATQRYVSGGNGGTGGGGGYMETIYPREYYTALENKKALEKESEELSKKVKDLDTRIENEKFAEAKAKVDAAKAAVTGNLAKIDILPDPKWIDVDGIASMLKDRTTLTTYFKILCFDDTAYFDLLKNYAFELKKGEKPASAEKKASPTGLSHPLPIKYSFKILGNSGIRRGDMFNIIGIPSKYSKHGLFQVTEIQHSLDGSLWTTQITGAYRQYQ
jgi:hypothetical protein